MEFGWIWKMTFFKYKLVNNYFYVQEEYWRYTDSSLEPKTTE